MEAKGLSCACGQKRVVVASCQVLDWSGVGQSRAAVRADASGCVKVLAATTRACPSRFPGRAKEEGFSLEEVVLDCAVQGVRDLGLKSRTVNAMPGSNCLPVVPQASGSNLNAPARSWEAAHVTE